MTISDNVAEQAEQCLKNIQSALQEANASLEDVVRVMYILPDAKDFPAAGRSCANISIQYVGGYDDRSWSG